MSESILGSCEVQQAGGRAHVILDPAEELEAFDASVAGVIEAARDPR